MRETKEYIETDAKELLEIAKTKSIFKDEFATNDANDMGAYFGEAAATRALEFFDIEYNNESDKVKYPSALVFERAKLIVSAYEAIVECEFEDLKAFDKEILIEAIRYDDFTRDSRGADDGTFDYAGSYVDLILDVLQKHFEQLKD